MEAPALHPVNCVAHIHQGTFIAGRDHRSSAVLLSLIGYKVCILRCIAGLTDFVLLDADGDSMHSAAEVSRLQQELELLRLKDLQQEHHIHVLTQQLRSIQAGPSQVCNSSASLCQGLKCPCTVYGLRSFSIKGWMLLTCCISTPAAKPAYGIGFKRKCASWYSFRHHIARLTSCNANPAMGCYNCTETLTVAGLQCCRLVHTIQQHFVFCSWKARHDPHELALMCKCILLTTFVCM